ncbi:hypothetical protein EDD18DRAFT_1466815 [Armillaria luteobubalina]|uniref:F-box domain-containing protein n=1 Tax=Armillaria luteobubalina TaxID=153913 RepID=A0AA39PLW3_9AGAR|nr:hypothetical protein EDD18DRAFT_1466815 [Armillaria luteobubalina]
MLKEFDLPQELVDRIVDELENDNSTLRNLLLVSRSFRERARYHIFRVFTLRQYSNHELDLITHLFSETSPIPLLVRSLHIYPFNPALNDILPLLRNVSHIHLRTASREILRSTGLAQVLSTNPLTTLHIGEPQERPLAPSTSIHCGDFFDFVRCFPERIQYVSLMYDYTWERPSAEDTSTIKGPSVGTLNLSAAGQNERVFHPNQSGVTIFSAIDQLRFSDSSFDNIRSIVRSLPPLSVQKLCIPCQCVFEKNFTPLDCLGVSSLSILINIALHRSHALEHIIKKLESTPVKSSLNNLQIILAFRPSRVLHDILLQPSSDRLWKSLAELAHRIGGCEITITNAVPFFESSLREWDRNVSRMTTKLRGHFMQAGRSLDVRGVYCEDPNDPVELFVH